MKRDPLHCMSVIITVTRDSRNLPMMLSWACLNNRKDICADLIRLGADNCNTCYSNRIIHPQFNHAGKSILIAQMPIGRDIIKLLWGVFAELVRPVLKIRWDLDDY